MKLATRIFRRNDWYVTSPFGYRKDPITGVTKFHNGTDYGTNIQNWKQYALEDGQVIGINTGAKNKDVNGGFGNYVKVKYPRLGIQLLHAHLKDVYVKNGQKVNKDTVLGTTGMTGYSTGVHLHLGMQNIGSTTWKDPHAYDYQEAQPTPTNKWPKTHVVVAGDTLSGIAEKYYGNGDKEHYMFIAEANNISNPSLINVGQVLTIPEYKSTSTTFKVGDKVKVTGGRAYETPDGTGNCTGVYEGETRYITKITDLNKKCPYHISVGSKLGDRDRGWVEGKYLKK